MRWNLRCDCAADRNPLICSIYVAEAGLYLHRPPLKGPHAETGRTVKREAKDIRLEPNVPAAEIVTCSRCGDYYALTTGLLPPQEPIVVRLGLPKEKPAEAGEYVTILPGPRNMTIQILPGIFLTPLGEAERSRTVNP